MHRPRKYHSCLKGSRRTRHSVLTLPAATGTVEEAGDGGRERDGERGTRSLEKRDPEAPPWKRKDLIFNEGAPARVKIEAPVGECTEVWSPTKRTISKERSRQGEEEP